MPKINRVDLSDAVGENDRLTSRVLKALWELGLVQEGDSYHMDFEVSETYHQKKNGKPYADCRIIRLERVK